MTEKVQFSEADWNDIFPTEYLMIGAVSVPIRALSLEDISGILDKQIPLIMEMFQEEIKILTEGGKLDPEAVPDKVKSIITKASFFLTEAGTALLAQLVPALDKKDIRKFPPATILDIVAKVLHVNILSMEQLEKNLFPLITEIKKMIVMRGAMATV